jgi:MIP family channel proteins
VYTLTQKLCAEFIGTFAVIFFATGAICSDEYLRSTGQGAITTLGLALAYGLAVGVMVSAVAHISGGHLNPAVTIGFWVTKRLSTTLTVLYWIAQLLGAIAAAYLISALIPDAAAWRLEAMNAINPALAPDFTRLHGMLLEGIMTFFLVFVFFATMVDVKGAFHKLAGFGVGFAVTMDALFGYPLTHAALNPARAFGPSLATRHWSNHGVYWVGPLLGGVLASVIYDRIFLVDQPPL